MNKKIFFLTLNTKKTVFLQAASILILIGSTVFLWNLMQSNLNSLELKFNDLHQDIKNLETPKYSKEKIQFTKDLLLIEKEKINIQNSMYGILIQLLGGVFFFITAYFSWRNVKATEQKQFSERFNKAVEQLASNKKEVQLGGLYALERIAIDSESDHWVVMEVLTSFVRGLFYGEYQETIPSLNHNIQVAITIIGRRNIEYDRTGKNLVLSNANLKKTNLKDCNFRKSILYSANLNEANLEKADLRETYLGKASFIGANLKDAKLDNVNCITEFSVKGVNFSQASLIKAKFISAVLTGSNLSQADLNEANFQLAYLYKVNFTNAKLVSTDLSKSDLSLANFRDANLDGAKLDNANIYRADFTGAKGLTSKQITKADNWKHAIYDSKFEEELPT